MTEYWKYIAQDVYEDPVLNPKEEDVDYLRCIEFNLKCKLVIYGFKLNPQDKMGGGDYIDLEIIDLQWV